jgi:hypothetical protein
MRRVRVVGSAFGALALLGACATMPPATAGSSRLELAESPVRSLAVSRTLDPAERDSVVAQMVADREGPGVTINAQFVTFASSRRVRANFHLDDDAYVVVGQIDADGVLRVVFPANPTDDGFVKGDKSYQTSDFFAGFTDQFRYRAQNSFFYRGAGVSQDSYDGGLGVVFVIASWRPMRIDRFATDGKWDSFELADQDYLRDPRPAVHEFAALLAGDNREAYTVKFARYFSTMATYADFGSRSAYGFSQCPGYASFGFASSPFGGFGFNSGYNLLYRYGYNFTSRGTNYYYDNAGDCYYNGSQFGGFGYAGGYRIAEIPGRRQAGGHAFDVNSRRPPVVPQPVPRLRMPVTSGATPVPVQQTEPGSTSPHYRQRGLLTADDGNNGPARRPPRIENPQTGERYSRPSIQEMAGHRLENTNDGAAGGRPRQRTEQSPSTAPRSEPAPRSTPHAPPAAAAPRSTPAAPASTSKQPSRN